MLFAHKMIHRRSLCPFDTQHIISIHFFVVVVMCVCFSAFFIFLFFFSGYMFLLVDLLLILGASAHVIWICAILLLHCVYNKLHIHAIRQEFITNVDDTVSSCLFFALDETASVSEALLLFVLRNRLIISRELSFKTDNLY